ncbi:hypothetical protein AVEN_56003-1 [Araneus ventricosus]|uniref:Uncharacterized protein n=1 Tax=Araneus ventricosus TaxID=182803 RepID=A0A4Y2KM40_ARAVE|nr:hypothetical protein AVEN_56003-1 [Araneus ventricosus]
MAARHPEWFHPSSFSQAVLRYSLRKIGWLPPEDAVNLNRAGEDFRKAVKTVGKAVFSLQVIIRNRLRELFIESVNLVAGVVDGHNPTEILEFMTQGYLEKDVFNFMLSIFAVIAELIIFLDEFGIPIPPHSYHMPWCNIYSHRLTQVFASRGGWERLLEVAKRRYIDTEFYRETLISFVDNTPIPYAEEGVGNNWPENPLEFLQERFDIAPQSRTLAMAILRELYAHKIGLVPFPEEEQLWLLP